MQSTPISLFIEIYVDPFMCTGCGTCVDQCSMGVFEMQEKIAEPVRGNSCIGCFQCKNFCPTGAIQTRWVMRA
jgi:NAD-dependent dihydropyrimidine dehydrogenase PreA subunit